MARIYNKEAILKNLIFTAGESSTNFIHIYVIFQIDIHLQINNNKI